MAQKPLPPDFSALTYAEKDVLILSMWVRLEALESMVSKDRGMSLSLCGPLIHWRLQSSLFPGAGC